MRWGRAVTSCSLHAATRLTAGSGVPAPLERDRLRQHALRHLTACSRAERRPASARTKRWSGASSRRPSPPAAPATRTSSTSGAGPSAGGFSAFRAGHRGDAGHACPGGARCSNGRRPSPHRARRSARRHLHVRQRGRQGEGGGGPHELTQRLGAVVISLGGAVEVQRHSVARQGLVEERSRGTVTRIVAVLLFTGIHRRHRACASESTPSAARRCPLKGQSCRTMTRIDAVPMFPEPSVAFRRARRTARPV